MTKQKSIAAEFREIKADYKYDPDIMNEEDERSSSVKEILGRLSLEDRTIIMLYIYYQSYRKLAKRFGVSHMTIRRWVVRIKKKILEEHQRKMKLK